MRHLQDEQLALFAGRDLAVEESHIVTAHLSICSECRERCAEFQDVQSFVADSLRNPDQTDLTKVREGVIAQLQRRQRHKKPAVRWLAGSAAAAVLLIAILNMEHRTAVPAVPKAPRAVAVAPMASEKASAALVQPAPPRSTSRFPVRWPPQRETGIRSVTLIAREGQPSIIKMTTLDPNVVILWQPKERTNAE